LGQRLLSHEGAVAERNTESGLAMPIGITIRDETRTKPGVH